MSRIKIHLSKCTAELEGRTIEKKQDIIGLEG